MVELPVLAILYSCLGHKLLLVRKIDTCKLLYSHNSINMTVWIEAHS